MWRRIATAAFAAMAALTLLLSTGGAAHAAGGSPLDSGFITIQNRGTNGCLQAESTAAEVRVLQVPCVVGNQLQHWKAIHDTGNIWKLQNRASGLCVNEFDALAPGARLLMIQCVRVSNELWNLHTQTPTTVALLESRAGNKDTQYCADAVYGVAPLMNACIGVPTQYWTILFTT